MNLLRECRHDLSGFENVDDRVALEHLQLRVIGHNGDMIFGLREPSAQLVALEHILVDHYTLDRRPSLLAA